MAYMLHFQKNQKVAAHLVRSPRLDHHYRKLNTVKQSSSSSRYLKNKCEEEEEKNLEQNKRKIRRGDAWINPCLVIWREMFNFIPNFSPNFSLCTLFLLSLIKHVQNPNPKAVHYGDNLSILSLERI